MRVELCSTSDGSVVAELPVQPEPTPPPSTSGRLARRRRGQPDGTAAVFDAGSGELSTQLHRTWHDLDVVAVAFSPDGDRLATLSTDGSRPGSGTSDSGKQLLRAGGRSEPTTPTCPSRTGPPSRSVRTGSAWLTGPRLRGRRQALGRDERRSDLAALQGSTSGVTSELGFSPSDGRFIVTAGYFGNSVRLWDGHSGRLLSAVT